MPPCIAGDRSRIVGAIDGDLNRTRGAVYAGDVKGFVNAVTDVQIVESTVGREGPVTGGVNSEIADGAVDSCSR